jgi:hypothetical protein
MIARLTARVPARRILGVHPGLILVVLDIIGLLIASYLSVVELQGGVPVCGPLKGCETVATSSTADRRHPGGSLRGRALDHAADARPGLVAD